MYGEKHVCASCGCKFYDLGKEDAFCPKCNLSWKEKPKKVVKAKVSKKKAVEIDVPVDIDNEGEPFFGDFEEASSPLNGLVDGVAEKTWKDE